MDNQNNKKKPNEKPENEVKSSHNHIKNEINRILLLSKSLKPLNVQQYVLWLIEYDSFP